MATSLVDKASLWRTSGEAMGRVDVRQRFKRAKAFSVLALCFLAGGLGGPALAEEDATQTPKVFAVLKFRPGEADMYRAQAIADWLNQGKLGEVFIGRAMEYAELEKAVAAREVAFVLTQPSHYIQLAVKQGLGSPLATMVDSGGTTFGGAVFATASRPDLDSLRKLEGARVAITSKSSLGSFMSEAYEMKKEGGDPEKLVVVSIGGSQADALLAVVKGEAEAAFVRTGVYEDAIKKGIVKPSALKIIHEMDDERAHKFKASTLWYPNWSVSAMPWVDEHAGRRVAARLLLMEDDGEAAARADLHGFHIPMDYAPVDKMLKTLRIAPYDSADQLSVGELFDENKKIILGSASLISLLAGCAMYYMAMLARRAKQSAKESKAASARISSILEGTAASTWQVNVKTERGFVDERFAKTLGLVGAGQKPMSVPEWMSMTHEEDLPRIMEHYRAHLKGKTDQYECEYRMRHANGEWLWFLDSGSITERDENGRPLWLSGTRMDVTARRKAQDMLAEQLDFVEVLLEAIPVGMYIENEAGFVMKANKAYEEMFGVSRLALLADSGKMAGPHSTQGSELAREKRAELVDGVGSPSYEAEFIHGTTGDMRLARHALAMFKTEKGESLMVGAAFDISAKAMEEALLREATAAAEAANIAKTQFVANMSHEIRTPMNAVLGMLQLIERQGLTQAQSPYFEKAKAGAGALLSLVNDILDFSKAESGRLELDPRWFALSDFLSTLAAVLPHASKAHKVDLIFDVSPDVPRTVWGDDVRLRQVLTNLLGNALKFTNEGSVKLDVSLGRSDTGCVVKFKVIDTGIGIAKLMQEKIFDPFSQAESSITRRFGGTGLGLSICSMLVKQMGGQIDVDSQEGLGSTFSFAIVMGNPGLPSPIPIDVAEDKLNASIVLDLDCSPESLIAEAKLSSYKRLGMTVKRATSLEDALNLLMHGEPPAVVAADGEVWGREIQFAGKAMAFAVAVRKSCLSRKMREPALLSFGVLEGENALWPQIKMVASPFWGEAVAAAIAKMSDRSPQTLATVSQPTSSLAGLRCLVVDDNEVNRLIAKELLQSEGARVECASNGQEAVDRVQSGGKGVFGAILMDIQMPVLDGYGAARAIRRLGFSDLPIYAMTANALASDKAACKQAGMDGHIGKPFVFEELIGLLAPLAPTSETIAKSVLTPAPKIFNEQGDAPLCFDPESAAQRMGNERIYLKVLGTFAKDASKMVASLEAAANAGDWRIAAREAHSIKGSARSMGAFCLGQHAELCEKSFSHKAIPAAGEDAANKLIVDLKKECAKVLSLIENHLASRR